jgi:hypothetical protein
MSRLNYTQQFLGQLSPDARLSLGEALVTWWQDSRSTGGLRLSWTGYAVLVNDLDIEFWQFDFAKQGIPPWIYLRLDHHLTAPYYMVDNKKLTSLMVFSSRDAMMINLYGTVEKWIAGLE